MSATTSAASTPAGPARRRARTTLARLLRPLAADLKGVLRAQFTSNPQRRLLGPISAASANLPQSAGVRPSRRQLLWRIQTVSGSLPQPVSRKDRVRYVRPAIVIDPLGGSRTRRAAGSDVRTCPLAPRTRASAPVMR
jgi:hypothetical protein